MVDYGDGSGQRRKVKRLFYGTVAAADDGDVTSSELCAVSFRAGAYAAAEELAFAGHVEGPGRRAHGKDHSTAAVLGIARAERLRFVVEIESVYVARAQLGAEVLCLPPHRISQRRTRDEWTHTGVVVYPPGAHERTAGLMAFDDKCVQPGPSRVDRSGVSGCARPDDDDITNPGFVGHQAAAMRWLDRGRAPSACRMTAAVWASSRASCGKACLPSVSSEVDGVAGQSVEAFLQTLAEGGVGVHVAGQLGGGQVPELGCGQFGE